MEGTQFDVIGQFLFHENACGLREIKNLDCDGCSGHLTIGIEPDLTNPAIY
jgi:hypothetical protein